jgi:hypothetical protein
MGYKSIINTLYIGATINAILAAFFVAIDLGIISPKTSNKNVTIHVASHTAVAWLNPIHHDCHNHIAIVVAKAAVNVFTKLFQIRIVISSLSLFFLIFFKDLLQNLFFLKRDSSL